MPGSEAVPTLLTALRALPPWNSERDFSPTDWNRYLQAARAVQLARQADVEHALMELIGEGEGSTPVENETRAFLLLRLVFALPERAPAGQRRVFKGWINWPMPDEEGNVNLSWPVSVSGGQPVLLAHYAGAEGPGFAADLEYRHLLATYPYRNLGRLADRSRSDPSN